MITCAVSENHALAKLSEWQLLLIIYYSIGSFDSSMLGPIDAVRRICEVSETLFGRGSYFILVI